MRKARITAGVIAGIAALALPGTANAAPAQWHDWSLVENVGLGACVSAAPGDSTVVEECDGSRSQRWTLDPAGPIDGEDPVYRLRKNRFECAELVGDWASAWLQLGPCDPHAGGQLFRTEPAADNPDGVHLISLKHGQVLKAYQVGQAPFTSATLEWPGDFATWTFTELH